MKIRAAAGTHAGCIRRNNEDNFYINGHYRKDVRQAIYTYKDYTTKQPLAYAVFDGVGGAENGELASLLTADRLVEFDDRNLSDRFDDYVQDANRAVCQARLERGRQKMGSTVVLLAIEKGIADICNVGDSRAYLFRNDKLKRLSADHTKERAADSDKRNHALTQFIGAFPNELAVEPYRAESITLREEDIFLLCSDGLTDMVSEEALAEQLSKIKKLDPEQIVRELIDEAIKNGGRDNVTALAVKIEEDRNGLL